MIAALIGLAVAIPFALGIWREFAQVEADRERTHPGDALAVLAGAVAISLYFGDFYA